MAHAHYLTYEEYTAYGGDKTLTEFVPLEFQARKAIDYVTDSRVQDMETVPEAVKLCMLSSINIIATTGAEAQATNPQATQFATDGYSESYGHAMTVTESKEGMYSMIAQNLYGELDDNGVPLIYRGVHV